MPELKDVERAKADSPSSSTSETADPFSIRNGLKTEEELVDLRQVKKSGKRLEKYHRKQNDVRFSSETYVPAR